MFSWPDVFRWECDGDNASIGKACHIDARVVLTMDCEPTMPTPHESLFYFNGDVRIEMDGGTHQLTPLLFERFSMRSLSTSVAVDNRQYRTAWLQKGGPSATLWSAAPWGNGPGGTVG